MRRALAFLLALTKSVLIGGTVGIIVLYGYIQMGALR